MYAPANAGADRGFLERGFIYIYIKGWGFALLIVSLFSEIPYFIFIGYLKTGGGGGEREREEGVFERTP